MPASNNDDPRVRPSGGQTTEELIAIASGWADHRSERIGGLNPWAVAISTGRACVRDRVSGLAAEMSFFALLSLVPTIVALGAGLSLLEGILGAETVSRGQAATVVALSAVFSDEVTEDVVAPLVDGLLSGQRGGIALSSLLATTYLASRVFTSTIRALDLAYNVPERRGFLVQRLLAVVFAVGSVVVVVLTLIVWVVGPLFGTGQDLADRLGFSEVFAVAWQVARLPVLLVIAVAFFGAVYRFAPNVRHRFHHGLPGAVLAVGLWLAVSAGLRVYLATVGGPGPGLAGASETVAFLGQVVGALAAAVLWVFLSSLSLLIGGELNAEIARARGGPRARPAPRGGRRRRRLR